MSILAPLPFLREQSTKPREDPELLRSLLEIYEYGHPQLQLLRLASVAAPAGASTITHRIEPPTAEDEWLIYAITVDDISNLDSADDVRLHYVNSLGASSFELQRSLLSAFLGAICKWPNFTTTNNGIVKLSNPPLIVSRKSTGERQYNISVTYLATATVGNRDVGVDIIYATRRRLH